jgi:hypothetical protein
LIGMVNYSRTTLKGSSTYACRDLSNLFTWKLTGIPLQVALYIEHFKPASLPLDLEKKLI